MDVFSSDSLTYEEMEVEVVSVVCRIKQCNYILIRNHIITKWRENMSIWVKKDIFGDVIPKRCSGLLDYAYKFLLSYAYINFGVVLANKNRIPVEPSKDIVIFI
ncbi:hypothetical protein RDI58_017584 [Solanum bulbocastanum]|uniref:SWIRM domain-containing protein n=1 Tax=Solanum bulbocastanum TaxID=147425 RepID=A0AAN8T9S6_SOLBU